MSEEDEFESTIKPPSDEELDSLRIKHTTMYSSRLASGSPVVNVSETNRYLRIWQGMAGKTYAQLNDEERDEVIDAIESGE